VERVEDEMDRERAQRRVQRTTLGSATDAAEG
jgi:hypothetical protein